MRRWVPLLAGVLLLVGCAPQNPGDAYVSAVVEEVPQILDRGTEAELAELGVNVCEYIDSGMTAAEVTADFSGGGWSDEEASAVVTNAVEHICP